MLSKKHIVRHATVNKIVRFMDAESRIGITPITSETALTVRSFILYTSVEAARRFSMRKARGMTKI
tara:strand:- start:3657 stop:3854 length:198 start_codon:yes stop_codon:yes gene_type:complete